MRRVRADNLHSPPYLEDLIEEAGPPLLVVEQVTLRSANEFTTDVTRSLSQLWSIFENLSYNGKSRRGLTGVVGMSKAVLLLTNGRIGPAFDSEVRRKLTIKAAEDSGRWIAQLESVAADIESFERQNGCRLAEIVPERFRALHNGRLYDMAFGPRG